MEDRLTEDFNFEVVRYSFADSNIHTNVGLGIFYGQLVHVARICSRGTDFEKSVLELYHTFLLYGYDREALLKFFFSFCTSGGLYLNTRIHDADDGCLSICYRADIVGLVDWVFNR